MSQFRVALRGRSWEAASHFLAASSDLVARVDGNGRALVGYAMQDGRWDEASWLLRAGAPWDQALDGLLRHGDGPCPADLEVSLWAHVAATPIAASVLGGEPLLALAVAGGRLHAVDALSMRPQILDATHWRRVWMAAMRRFDVDICEMLFLRCPQSALLPLLTDLAGLSLSLGKTAALSWLTMKGLDVQAPDVGGATLLGRAAQAGRSECLAWLIEQGAHVDALDGRGHSALYHAVARGDEKSVCLLVAAGANPELRQGVKGQGSSPIRLAAKSGARALRQMLLPGMEAAALRQVAGVPESGGATRSSRL